MIDSPALAARRLKPIAVLAAGRNHGDRLRYLAGCRCADCRRANSAYESSRAKARRNGDWNGIVPAATARAHLIALSKQGVGRTSVAAATDIARSMIVEIRQGKRLKIRARTERKILAVTKAQAADHALVPARPTWKLIGRLLDEGYTKSFIATCLGYSSPALQLGRNRVTVRNAHQVECVYRDLTA